MGKGVQDNNRLTGCDVDPPLPLLHPPPSPLNLNYTVRGYCFSGNNWVDVMLIERLYPGRTSYRETYRMQLDSARNHIILVNLWISVASISLMVAALPSAFFGMNVHHGLEVGLCVPGAGVGEIHE